MEYEPHQLGESKFCYYNGMCMAGKCPKHNPFNASAGEASCGWDFVFGEKDCPLEATQDDFTHYAWKPQLRGTLSEGKPYYSEALVPVASTREEGLKVLR